MILKTIFKFNPNYFYKCKLLIKNYFYKRKLLIKNYFCNKILKIIINSYLNYLYKFE